MGTSLETPATIDLKEYPIAEALELRKEEIAQLAEEYLPLVVAKDGTGLEEVHAARMDIRNRRVAVTKRGKELRADANAFSKKVIAAEKELVELLDPIETHLKKEEGDYKAEQERLKREAAEKQAAIIRSKVEALAAYGRQVTTAEVEQLSQAAYDELLGQAREEHELRLKREAEEKAERERKEAEEREKREAEEAKLRAERERLNRTMDRVRAFSEVGCVVSLEVVEKMADEEYDANLATAKIAHEEKLREEAEAKAQREAEAKKLREEREQLEREKAEQLQAKLREEAAERARQEERDRIEREQREAKERAEREEALRPDREKLEALADKVEALSGPAFDTPWLSEQVEGVLQLACDSLREIALTLK